MTRPQRFSDIEPSRALPNATQIRPAQMGDPESANGLFMAASGTMFYSAMWRALGAVSFAGSRRGRADVGRRALLRAMALTVKESARSGMAFPGKLAHMLGDPLADHRRHAASMGRALT